MSIETYLQELADLGTPVKSSRLIALSGLTEEERSTLTRVWFGLPSERRRSILEQVGLLAEDTPELDFDAVFLTALRDPEPALRRLALDGLWEHEERELIGPLIDLLQTDSDLGVRGEAARSLGRFVLLGEFGDVRPSDATRVSEALRSVATEPQDPPWVRARALEALGAGSQPWVSELITEAYDSGDSDRALGAVQAMGRSADDRWVAILLTELGNTDPHFRYEAAVALGEIEDEEATAALLELVEDEDPEVQEAAIQALGRIGGDAVIEGLRRRLDDADERLQAAIQEALDDAVFGDDPLGLRP